MWDLMIVVMQGDVQFHWNSYACAECFWQRNARLVYMDK